MTLPIIRRRGGLHRAIQHLAQGTLSIGFLGGSITDARPGHNWPEPVISWFVEQFPKARIQVENAAIGGTGSDLAVFRVERDILRHECGLVFVEYAVNDPAPTEQTLRSREGLIRKLLAGQGRDVVLVYTFNQPMYQHMIQDLVPPTIGELETLAEHYGLPSIWMGLNALRDVQAGRMRWEEWLPDGLHPQSRGSFSYGQSVITLLEEEFSGSNAHRIPSGDARPLPFNEHNWERTALVPFAAVTLRGPWTIRRWPHLVWMDQVLSTAAVGASLSFPFSSRGLTLGFDFGRTSAEFRFRLDGGAWTASARDRPAWLPDSGLYRIMVLADDLELGDHTCEVEVVHGDDPDCTGTNFHLAFIGLIR